MRVRILVAVIFTVVGIAGGPSAAQDQDFLEMWFGKCCGTYWAEFFAQKVGAVTCHITTPNGNFACEDLGDRFVGGDIFLENHEDLSFFQLTDLIATSWTLIWDQEMPSQTTVTIDFGEIQESEFPAAPTVVFPADGVIYVNPDPNPFTVEWTYGVDPCTVQLDDWFVFLNGPGDVVFSSGDLEEGGCDVTSWTPPVFLAPGEWKVGVINAFEIRDVYDGLQIIGDPWVLDNGKWLALVSEGQVDVTVPTRQMSMGQLKALYR